MNPLACKPEILPTLLAMRFHFRPLHSPITLTAALAVLAGFAAHGSAQVLKPYLAADINTQAVTNHGSNPGGPVNQGGSAALGSGSVFSAYEPVHGTELWFSDGTASGTHLVKDIQPGSRSSSPQWMASLGNLVIFVASSDLTGQEIWRTDGTEAGTYVIKDMGTGTSSMSPTYTVAAGPYVYFTTASNGQLWRTDGTDAGTIPLTAAYANVTAIAAVGDRVYFPASSSAEGTELWTSDGTVLGTHLVKDIVPGTGSSSPRSMYAAGNRLVFFPYHPDYGYEPWISDGTEAGTVLAKDIEPGIYSNYVDRAGVSSGKIYFAAQSPEAGQELWESDGTVGGTKLSADIVPGTESSYVSEVTGCTTGALFLAEISGVRNAYFRAASGVTQLTHFSFGDNFYIYEAAGVGSRIYFLAYLASGAPNFSLWSTDGTAGGTQVLASGLGYTNLIASALDGKVMLNLDNGIIGPEPWVSDGTSAGTTLIADICTGLGESSPRNLTSAAGRLLFVADDEFHGRELWSISPGSPASLVADSTSGPDSTQYYDSITFNDRAVFWRYSTAAGTEPWITDGTAAGTSLLADVEPGSSGSYSSNYTNALPEAISGGGKLYYVDLGASNNSRRNELVASDGTTSGTRLLDINTKPSAGSQGNGINGALISGTLIFAADDGSHGAELWRTDGTVAGTSMIREFIPGATGGLSLTENRFISFGQTVLFGATDNIIGSELYKTDGTPGGTVLLKDIRPGSLGSQPNPIADLGGRVLLLATTAAEGRELWITDGTADGTQLIADTNPGAASASLLDRPLVNAGKAFFANSISATGRELWVSDGTPAGTHLVKDIRPGNLSGITSTGALLGAAGGRVYFTADDGEHGVELWTSDGTDAGTYMVDDIWPGLPSSFPGVGAIVGSTLYFDAYRPGEGEELWALKVCPADFDDSGFIDREDYDAFVLAFVDGDDSADFDGSGFVDETDFVAFVAAFEVGC